ncbi:tRNA (guanosine(37)-N1)-methyltransferase TrmD [Clostridium thermarum]|uniref:tRNA (guanosine(37)-N1)-methyltransferase TrmD n=1 Tax=Clostridium thermarum TaxID=1716543 RepID=UPI0013D70A05|nr:tRNA (guanosine(37)-N1)-methyltransferase TrmD [Clostridium thermarum]
MKISILTLFPEIFDVFNYSIIGKAQQKGFLEINTYNIRDFTADKHRKVDDYPYGGGAGMVMSVQPIADCIKHVKALHDGKVIFLGPKGKTFNQELAKELSKEEHLIFLCGHYEGIDERAYNYIDMEVSLGDFVLTGGEAACIPIVDSISRLLPGVLSNDESYKDESFYEGLLEYPQYTRPPVFEEKGVPEVLLSGHHENIRKWRKYQSLKITAERRPDLFSKYQLSAEEKKLFKKFSEEK